MGLLESGLVRRSRDGVRLLGKGDLTTQLEIQVTGASKAAIAAVEKVGGSVTLSQPKSKPEGKGKAHERQAKKDKAGKPQVEVKSNSNDPDDFRGGKGNQVSEGAGKSPKESDEA